jgi:hypothetical protein
MTGSWGYFGKAGSVAERLQKENIEPRADSIRRACRQSAQRPSRGCSFEILFSSTMQVGYCIAGTSGAQRVAEVDHFQNIIKTLLQAEGYRVRQSFKVNLSKEEKRRIGRPAIPRPEFDLLAFSLSQI